MKTISLFLGLLLLFSVPLWVAAAFVDATRFIPIDLPLSALQFVMVLLSAILVTRQNGEPLRALLMRGMDMGRISSPAWKAGIFVLMPLTIVLSYLLMLWRDVPLSDPMTPLFSLPIFLLIYALSAFCEQLGWTAIMTDELLKRNHGVIAAGLIVGSVWAFWHLIPFIQTHNPPAWIFWQCVYTVISRVLFTKVYILTQRSVFSTIALHATYDTAFSMMPYYGSSYDPAYMTFATFCVSLLVFVLPAISRAFRSSTNSTAV